jgi:hypothetical protein
MILIAVTSHRNQDIMPHQRSNERPKLAPKPAEE